MKKKKILVGTMALLTICLNLNTTPVSASTSIDPDTNISIYGSDVEEVDTNTYQIKYDSTKNDTTNPYNFSYKVDLSAQKIWSSFNTFRFLYILQNNEEQWKTKKMLAEWEIRGSFDKEYVTVDSNAISKEAVQARFEELNPDTDFFKYIKCYSSVYDEETGEWIAKFRLETAGTEGALAYLFDDIQPTNLVFSTPKDMLTVKQSDFVEGKSFTSSNMKLSGSLTIQYMYLSQLPITFETDPLSATINMVSADEFKIVDNYRDDDGILVTYRTGDTGESAPTYISTDKKYPTTYNLKLQSNGVDLTEEQLKKVTWSIKGDGNYPDSFASSIGSITDGTNQFIAKKSGVVKLIATYEGNTAEINMVVPGDITRDGKLNSLDSTAVNRYAFSNAFVGVTDDKFTPFLADMNGDGKYNSFDAQIIQKMYFKALSPSN